MILAVLSMISRDTCIQQLTYFAFGYRPNQFRIYILNPVILSRTDELFEQRHKQFMGFAVMLGNLGKSVSRALFGNGGIGFITGGILKLVWYCFGFPLGISNRRVQISYCISSLPRAISR
ncbi:MAG: hypothetical protein HUU54_14145 [Ignavibacteriaceae bacterium]|nr:hypothetical protein [Ignavibacteriaceae bacterium]